jgi:HIV Tat-specific factor 1
MTASEDNTSVDKTSRVVVLRRMFTLQELEEDTSLLLDLKDDVREECSTLGEVTNVVLYDVRRCISPALITVNRHFSKNQTVS